jgi:site-specific recombinase XerD
MGPIKGGEELKEVKTGNERKIPMLKTVKALIDSIPSVLSPFVFINPVTKNPYSKNINRDVWNPASKKVLGYVFPLNNSGRHSFANQLLEQGIDMEVVMAERVGFETTLTPVTI